METATFNICITGAAGRIAYSFLPQLCNGAVFPGININLRLLDISSALKVMEGVVLELQDCNYPLLKSVTFSDKTELQLKDADVIVFLGSCPTIPGMKRSDMIHLNKLIFMEQSKALSFPSPNVKCVVVSNPIHSNTLILSHFAPHVKKENITSLTRLDHNRAIAQIASKTGCTEGEIQGLYIFGNHSPTQYPCINNIKVKGQHISNYVDKEWLINTFIPKVQKRGGQVRSVRGDTSVFSAANALIDHLKDWYLGSDRIVSMGIASEGDYGIPKGLWASLPVRCKGNFQYEIVKDIPLSDICKEKISLTVQQLKEEYSIYFNS